MTTFSRSTALALLAALTVISLSASSTAVAAPPQQKLLIAPGEPNGSWFPLPKFGFASFNTGFGERVTNVRWNSRAARLGLEPGDLILSMNGIPLRYTGSWNDALRQAMYDGGFVRLRVRDVRTGFVVTRTTWIDCYDGPIQYKNQVVYYSNQGPGVSHEHHNHHNHNGNHFNSEIKKIVKLVDKLKN
jgi:membrane-associated protease RseP (regulator of RpoE activity)